ncbi:MULTISPECIES: IclR family transcriptional regulator C-terminal domain-containing protein [unclassified Salinibacterium]|uniref:IclR family transcriptional regulator domain-containing protein n=1 Tax=unclassified Salinibacterium TaxID=2632331 RepID=UPI00142496D5|nr:MULTISPECIES: IclR family transcriptional regulator C-terminal domain-containing protein [unclassified Salinibacterium]
MTDTVEPTSDDFVQSFARGLAVIRAFDGDHPQLTLSEVAARAGIARAAARRFLRTLEALGYVRSDDRAFALTPRVLELGFAYLSSLSIADVAQPHLERLSREVDESVSAAVLDGSDIVYVARVATRRIMSVGITVGTRFPAERTSMGRALLVATGAVDVSAARARGWEVHSDGWALVDEELEAGLRAIAAPVRDARGRVVAAVNISTSTARTTLARMRDEFAPALLATTAAIETELRLQSGRS